MDRQHETAGDETNVCGAAVDALQYWQIGGRRGPLYSPGWIGKQEDRVFLAPRV